MSAVDFSSIERSILTKLDLQKEAELLGVRFVGTEPNSSGWLGCFAIGRDEKNPSAALCVAGTNGSLGKFTDKGGDGQSLSFWEVAVRSGRFSDWREARKHYAEKAGVHLPGEKKTSKAKERQKELESRVSYLKGFNELLVRGLIKNRKPITVGAIKAAGGRLASFPPKSPQIVLAFPGYRQQDVIAGLVLLKTDGCAFPAVKDKLGERRQHCVRGSKECWVTSSDGLRGMKRADVVLAVEGISDLLAVGDRLPDGWAAGTGIFGADNRHRLPVRPLKGKRVVVVGDCDTVGQAGAMKFAKAAAKVAAEVKIVKLPYEITEKHGRDLRDFLSDGHEIQELIELAEQAETVTADTEPQAQAGGDGGAQAAAIANFDIIQEGDTKRTVGRPMQIILEDIQKVAKGNIRRVDHSLFYHQLGQPEVTWIIKPPALFGLLGMLAGSPPSWKRDGGTHSKEETFAQLQVDAPCFSSVERFPHFPPILDAYYMHRQPSPGDGSALRELVGFFNPATEHDREMILALLVTPFWGGPPGARPAFLIGSDSGRGDGKTTLAQIAALLVGGALEFGANDDPGSIRTRLLSDEGLSRRTVILDNLKSSRLSLPEVESLITSPIVSGKRLYHGEGQRSNCLTWMLTSNTPGLCSDLSGRVVPIRLAKPKYSADWEDRLRDFVEASHDRIISDIAGFFESQQAQLSQVSRWGRWERDVLSRLKNPTEIQNLIAERRADSDSEVEEATILEDYVRSELEDLLFHDIDSMTIFIPSQTLVRWLNEATGEKRNAIAAGRAVKQMISEGKTRNLAECKSHARGRGYLWVGTDASGNEEVNRDLQAHEKYRFDRTREARLGTDGTD